MAPRDRAPPGNVLEQVVVVRGDQRGTQRAERLDHAEPLDFEGTHRLAEPAPELTAARRPELARDRLRNVEPLIQITLLKRCALALGPPLGERRAQRGFAEPDPRIEEALPAREGRLCRAPRHTG